MSCACNKQLHAVLQSLSFLAVSHAVHAYKCCRYSDILVLRMQPPKPLCFVPVDAIHAAFMSIARSLRTYSAACRCMLLTTCSASRQLCNPALCVYTHGTAAREWQQPVGDHSSTSCRCVGSSHQTPCLCVHAGSAEFLETVTESQCFLASWKDYHPRILKSPWPAH